MSTKAQIRTVRKAEAKNPDKTGYDRLKRQAKNFIEPKGGKSLAYVESDYAAERYLDDLKDLKIAIERRIEDLEK